MTAYNSSSGTENYGTEKSPALPKCLNKWLTPRALRSVSNADRQLGAMGASVNLSALHPVLTKLDPGAHLPAFVTDPTPAVFLIACCTYAAASLVYHKLHSDDKHQANFFVGGFALPFALGILLGADLRFVALEVLPWSTIVSLVVSAAFHGCCRPLEKEFDEERLMRL